MKKYPSDKGTTFLICEDVRQEVGNKASFMGTYFNRIVFSKDLPDDQMATPLAIVFIAEDGEGTYNSRLTIENPDGETRIDEDVGKHLKSAENPMMLVYKFGILGFSKEGLYKFKIHLDDKIYQKDVIVERAS